MKSDKSNFDKVFEAIDDLTKGITLPTNRPSHLVFLHDEANHYAFKRFDGRWGTISFEFANSLAGLGYINESML